MKSTRITTLSLGLVLFSISLVQAAESLSTWFPQETLVYMEGDRSDAVVEGWKNTSLSKILNEPEIEAFLAKPLAQLKEWIAKLEASSKLKQSDLDALLGEKMAFGLLMTEDGPVLRVTLAVKDPKAHENVLKAVPGLLEKYGLPKELEVSKAEGDAPQTIFAGPLAGVFTMDQGLLHIAIGENSEALLKKLPPLVKNKPKFSLAASKDYVSLQKKLGENPAFHLTVQLTSLQTLMKGTGADLTPLKSLGLLNCPGMGTALIPTPPGFTQRSVLLTDSPEEGVTGLIQPGPVEKSFFTMLPADITYLSVLRVASSKILPLVREIMVSSGEDPATIDQGLAIATMQLGFHPEKQFLNHLTGEVGCALLNPESIGGIPMLGLNGLVLMARHNNKEAIEKVFSQFCALAIPFAEGSSLGGGDFTLQHAGKTIKGVSVASGVIVPCYTVTENYLLFALTPQTLQSMLDTATGKEPNLTSNKSFLKTLSALGGDSASGLSYTARNRMSMPGGDLASMGILSGLLLPALSNARSAAQKANCTNNLAQIGKAIAMFNSEQYYGRMPENLEELYGNGDGIIGDLACFTCPEGSTGYHYIKVPINAKANSIIAFDAEGAHENGRTVLFLDTHVEHMTEEDFQVALRQQKAAMGDKMALLPSWGGKMNTPGQGEMAGAEQLLESLEDDPMAVVRTVLETIPLYRLPSSRSINRHLFASGTAVHVDAGSLRSETYGPLPIVGGFGDSYGTGLMTSYGAAMPAMIAAIAIPNLLESRMQANEANAIASLKSFATAQNVYLKASYSSSNGEKERKYCASFSRLGGPQSHKNQNGDPLNLIPDVMAQATSPQSGFQGYYFVDAKSPDLRLEFGLFAIPCEYGKGGYNTYYIGAPGIVYMKDTEGKLPEGEINENTGWFIP